jgi:hypothetical protein
LANSMPPGLADGGLGKRFDSHRKFIQTRTRGSRRGPYGFPLRSGLRARKELWGIFAGCRQNRAVDVLYAGLAPPSLRAEATPCNTSVRRIAVPAVGKNSRCAERPSWNDAQGAWRCGVWVDRSPKVP